MIQGCHILMFDNGVLVTFLQTEENMGELFGGMFGILLFILAIVLGVLWVMIPFLIFGIRNRLDRMLRLMESMQKTLNSTKSVPTTDQRVKDETSQTQIIEKSR